MAVKTSPKRSNLSRLQIGAFSSIKVLFITGKPDSSSILSKASPTVMQPEGILTVLFKGLSAYLAEPSIASIPLILILAEAKLARAKVASPIRAIFIFFLFI